MSGISTTQDIVAKLWNMSKRLQGGGVSYKDYVTELTYLLFLKMLAETDQDDVVSNPISLYGERLRDR